MSGPIRILFHKDSVPLRSLIAKLAQNPIVFRLSQNLLPFTVWQYKALLRTYVGTRRDERLLDLGCGVGPYSQFFNARYVGVDSDPACIAYAREQYPDAEFQVTNGRELDFEPDSFDHVLILAAAHHMNDDVLGGAIADALRVLRPTGRLHIVDPVWPLCGFSPVKRFILSHDRGRYPRSLAQLTALIAGAGDIEFVSVSTGFLHDVCYVRVSRR